MNIDKVRFIHDDNGKPAVVIEGLSVSIADDPEIYEIFVLHGEEEAVKYVKKCMSRGVRIMKLAEQVQLNPQNLTESQIEVLGDALRFRGEIND